MFGCTLQGGEGGGIVLEESSSLLAAHSKVSTLILHYVIIPDHFSLNSMHVACVWFVFLCVCLCVCVSLYVCVFNCSFFPVTALQRVLLLTRYHCIVVLQKVYLLNSPPQKTDSLIGLPLTIPKQNMYSFSDSS